MNNQIVKKRKDLTIKEKKDILNFLASNPHYTQRDLAKKYNIGLGTINKIIKEKDAFNIITEHEDKLNSKRLNRFLPKTNDFDTTLYAWFQSKRARNFLITQENIKEMALKLAHKHGINDFKASDGYLESFRKRYNIKSKIVSGESGLVNQDIIENFKVVFKAKLEQFADEDIYNADETGLFWRQSINRTLTVNEDDKASGKYSKERLTVLFCVSKAGEKLKPLVIGKSKNPQAFKSKNISNFNLTYKNNSKAWMSLTIFEEWLKELNSNLKNSNRKILLIIDNAPVHPKDVEYSNIELFYLIPNVTSLIQPCDQGIIKSFKDHYKKYINQKILFLFDDENNKQTYCELMKKITIYDSLSFIHQSWNDVTSVTVKNCFLKALENAKVINEKCISNELPVFEDFPAYSNEKIDDEQFLKTISDTEIEKNIENENNLEEDLEDNSTLYTSKDAFKFAEGLEHWFLNNAPAHLDDVLKLKQIIISEKKNRAPKITDYMTSKNN